MYLPGAYSLSAYSQEEVVARDVLLGGAVQAVINVVDAGILERRLLLTAQLREMGLPVVIACNMMDEARAMACAKPFLRRVRLPLIQKTAASSMAFPLLHPPKATVLPCA